MPDISDSIPTTDLPSTQKLIRSTLLAIVIASVILVAVVLPAEYGVDPTGIGNVLGLTEMGRIKTSLSKEVRLAEEEAAKVPAPSTTASLPDASSTSAAPIPPGNAPTARNDVTTITLEPNDGREIKLSMREGAKVTFSWSMDKGVVNYDTHADSKTPPRDYYGYEKGNGVASDEGVLVAAFDGWHGWYWRNRGKKTLTVTLRTDGDYQDIKEPE